MTFQMTLAGHKPRSFTATPAALGQILLSPLPSLASDGSDTTRHTKFIDASPDLASGCGNDCRKQPDFDNAVNISTCRTPIVRVQRP
jgi:hypothetical protein